MTITIAVRPAADAMRRTFPPIRVRPVPTLEPPTDDELIASGRTAPHPTAPVLPLSSRAAPMALAPVLAPAGMTGPGGTDNTESSAAAQATRRFLAACLEVLGGYRPVTHLRALCSADEFATIAQRLTGRTAAIPPGGRSTATHLNARTPVVGKPATGGPPRGARSAHPAPAERIAIRKVQVGEPVAGVAEVAVVLGRLEQVWAMALRLELHDGRWLCTYLHVL